MDQRDLIPFSYPALKDLKAINYRSVCLGSYIPWDVKRHYEVIARELGWEGDAVEGVPPGYDYEKIECSMQGVRDYLKFIKRGFARTTHLTSIDIRNGRLTREDAAPAHHGVRRAPPGQSRRVSGIRRDHRAGVHGDRARADRESERARSGSARRGEPLWDQSAAGIDRR